MLARTQPEELASVIGESRVRPHADALKPTAEVFSGDDGGAEIDGEVEPRRHLDMQGNASDGGFADEADDRIGFIIHRAFENLLRDPPGGSGLEVLRGIKVRTPDAVCVITTVMGDDTHIVAALSAGAQGYLLKEQPAELLSRQLTQLSAGVPALSPSIARRIMEHFQRTGPVESGDDDLSDREKQTLALISRGYRNSDVATQLSIAESTVASHIKSIYRKLGISSRAEAAWHATRLRL